MEQSVSVYELRIVIEQGFDVCVVVIVEFVIEDLGYWFVWVRISVVNGCMLQIMVECLDGIMIVEDCEIISCVVLFVFDVEDLINWVYYLEIFFLGIDWFLVCVGDFECWVGYELKIEMVVLQDGCKRFCGMLFGEDSGFVKVCLLDVVEGEVDIVNLLLGEIVEVKFVLMDDLIIVVFQVEKVVLVVCKDMDGLVQDNMLN